MANPTAKPNTERVDNDGLGMEVSQIIVNNKVVVSSQQANVADLAAITGGESPTEAEHNLIVTKVNAILDVLEAHGLMAAS